VERSRRWALTYFPMYGSQHPPSLGSNHPWHDPLAPQDLFEPRPDAEIALLGGGGPRPQDFPFDDQGRRDYYAAVRAEGQRLQQMHQAHHMHAAQARLRTEEEAAAAKLRAAQLLLLS
jgi:hypothetical protein